MSLFKGIHLGESAKENTHHEEQGVQTKGVHASAAAAFFERQTDTVNVRGEGTVCCKCHWRKWGRKTKIDAHNSKSLPVWLMCCQVNLEQKL
jgi:hypothetical protein